MSLKRSRSLVYRTLVIWFAILVLGSFAASIQSRSDPVGIIVAPEAPREGEPIVVTFYINNPAGSAAGTDYSLYANGNLVMTGRAELEPGAGRQFQYIYGNPLKMGEQVTFVARTQSENGDYDKSLSVPAYPPQVWSSFVSFASFSTSVMSSTSLMGSTSVMGSYSAISSISSMSSMGYYGNNFGTNRALNAGLIFSIVLIILLIYLELSEPLLAERSLRVIGDLRIRFSRLSAVLFIIFVGMVFTQVAIIVGGIR